MVTCEEHGSSRAAAGPHSTFIANHRIMRCPSSCRGSSATERRGTFEFHIVHLWRFARLVCKRDPAVARHRAPNDVVARMFVSAGVPVTKEPLGMARQDTKRPDGLTHFRGSAASLCLWMSQWRKS